MINNTNKLINEGIDKILEGDFTINPKVIDGTNVSCSFCEYRDICYLRERKILQYINRGKIKMEKMYNWEYIYRGDIYRMENGKGVLEEEKILM